jgi:hypothetical protein
LLLKTHSMKSKVKIVFGNQTIKISPIKKKESLRILGVWFNAYNRKEHIYEQIKLEIDNFTKLLRKKQLTDKHLMYLFNSLILPKIEYRAQLVVFTEEELEKLMSPFRRLFKNKLKFASSAPNVIVENSLIYKV